VPRRPATLAACLLAAAALAACEEKPAPSTPSKTPPTPNRAPANNTAPAPTGATGATGATQPAPAATGPTGAAAPTGPETVVAKGETPGGVVWEDLRIGTGKECPPGARVVMNYRGTLADGKEFDSSYKRNQPLDYSLTGLIKGWQEGVPGMKVGGKRRLVIPPELGYGHRGSPPNVPPDSTLIFEIELLDVK
jgi:FKBP-type peptidyl-prolyl cis-trans isomerase